ncbi:MAG: helix-turn-helix domain-containing protein [Clostridiales bacterium]|nr:helix-turn-helix domain-containing protein [Clostridiales bacterium]
MANELLSNLENGMLKTSGAVPVVFEGFEHVLEKTTPLSESSMHDTHELLFLRDGEIDLKIEGKKVSLCKGDTLVIRPHMAHTVRITSKKADMFTLYFGFTPVGYSDPNADNGRTPERKQYSPGPSIPIPKLAPTSLESFMQFATEGEENRRKDPYIIVSGIYKRDVETVAERIIVEKSENRHSKDLMLGLLTMELMIILSRAMRNEWEESLRVKNGKAKELVLIAKNYMDTNYDRGITINDVAAYVYLSQGYFTRAFKDEIGVSPMNYLMNVRITKACEMLLNNDIKVSAIATSVGFSSAQRFNVAFRKHMNMTPIEYRKGHSKDSGRSGK